jgi:hypothetical protein
MIYLQSKKKKKIFYRLKPKCGIFVEIKKNIYKLFILSFDNIVLGILGGYMMNDDVRLVYLIIFKRKRHLNRCIIHA